MKAAIYTRVSVLKGRTEDETSLVGQERACRAFCQARGWDFEVFSDLGFSAFKGKDRPGWVQVEAAVRSGEVGAVVVFAISRAARNTMRLLEFVELCQQHDVEFHSATEPISGSYGKVFLTLLGAFAELESETRSARTALWHEEKRRTGEWAGGRVPFSYKRHGRGGLVVVESEAEQLRQVAADVLAGASLDSLVRKLNGLGGRRWSRKTLRTLLESEHIAGLKGGQRAMWPPVITRRDHERLVRLFAQRSGEDRPSRPRSRKYLLTGLLICGRCGAPLKGRPDRGKRKYICLPTGHLSCDARALEELVTRRASAVYIEKEGVADPATVSAELQARRDEVTNELDDLASMPDLTAGEWRKRRAPLIETLAAIDRQLEKTPAGGDWRHIMEFDERTLDEYLADPALRPWLEQSVDTVTVAPGARIGAQAFEPNRARITWREGVVDTALIQAPKRMDLDGARSRKKRTSA